MGLQDALSVLFCRPAQRKAHEIQRLAGFLQDQSFFSGVGVAALQEISSALTFHQAAPGEVVLHVGELTDRLYVLLSGSCTVVRHSRREGFKPQPAQQLTLGKGLCEASLVVPGRRSDVEVTVSPAPAAASIDDGLQAGGGRDGGGGGGGGVAVFAVLTRGAWSSLCVRAPVQSLCGQARDALLCCCARSLAAVCGPPGARTLEQADDLAALLKQLPGLSHTPAPVLRAMSESAYLRQLPAGTILFEECTRAESEFLLLAGAVEIRRRQRRLGATGPGGISTSTSRKARRLAAGATAAGGAATATTTAAAVAVVDNGGKSLREKIEEERKAREAIKESLSLTREGLREPLTPPGVPSSPPLNPGSISRRWMSEYVYRARKVTPGPGSDDSVITDQLYGAAMASSPPGSNSTSSASAATGSSAAGGGNAKGNLSRAANAWRRAILGVMPHSQQSQQTHGSSAASTEAGSGGGGGTATFQSGDVAAGAALDEVAVDGTMDPLLAEYERLKAEEAGHVTDVGNLLGGAGSREAYIRGIREARARNGYGYDRADQDPIQENDQEDARPDTADGQWNSDGQDKHVIQADGECSGGQTFDPLLRLQYLDRHFQLASTTVRFAAAAEGLARLLEERGWESRAGNPSEAVAAEPTIQSIPDATDATLTAGSGAGKALCCNRGASNPGPGGETVEPTDEHLTQLYGPDVGIVDLGHIAGELPEAALCRAAGLNGLGAGAQSASAAAQPAPLLRRADTAIAGPSGADVLVVALEALRKGHEAARDDLVSERLAVLTALEPLRGLSDEHQAQLALGCTVISLDANQLVVRQGQPVDALCIVLEGEVRLLDDPVDAQAAAAAGTGGGGGGAVAGVVSTSAAAHPSVALATGRSVSLNGGTFGRKVTAPAASDAATAAAAVPISPQPPPPGSGTGGHGSIRTRRTMAALATLTLLGPGGSFGESVLGYPEGTAAAAVMAAEEVIPEEATDRRAGTGAGGGSSTGSGSITTTTSNDEDNEDDDDDEDAFGSGGTGGGRRARSPGFALGASALGASSRTVYETANGNGRTSLSAPNRTSMNVRALWGIPVSSYFLASVVTSRPTRLLVLPRSLLARYGYLRSSLPPLAQLRRDILNGRRQQLQTGLQTLPEVALGLLPLPMQVAPLPPASPAPLVPNSARGGLRRSPCIPPPRPLPPPQRPSEFLDQAGFKGLSNPRTAAVLGALNAAATLGGNGATGGIPRGGSAATDASIAEQYITSSAFVASSGHGAGGSSGSGSSTFPAFSSLTMAERVKRFRTTGSSPNGASWQFMESSEASSLADDSARLLTEAAMTTTTMQSLKLMTEQGESCENFNATEPTFALEQANLTLGSSGGGGGGGSCASGVGVLQAPPKPCAMRTSMTGIRHYGSAVVRTQLEMRGSASVLPLISTITSTSGVGSRELLLSPGSSSGGGGVSSSWTRRAASQGPITLRIDQLMSRQADDLATTDAATFATAIAAGTEAKEGESPPRTSHGAYYGSPPMMLVQATPASVGATEAESPPGSIEDPLHIPTGLAPLGSGSHPESPRPSVTYVAAAGGNGGGGGSGNGSGKVVPPLRATLLPFSSSFKKRASYTGNSCTQSGPQSESQWERMRESAPGEPSILLQHQPPYPIPLQQTVRHQQHQSNQRHKSQPQLTLYPTNLSASGKAGQGTSPRNRFQGGGGGGGSGGSRTTSQLELVLGDTSLDGTPRSLRTAFGSSKNVTGCSTHLGWGALPEMRSSWDGVTAQGAAAAAAAAGGGEVHIVNRGSTHAATELALAALAANQPPAAHFLLVP